MPSQHPAKKAAAKKATSARRDRPADIGVNFDSWSRDENVGPYVIVAGGQRYESLDPMDIDYRDLGKVVLNEDPDKVFELLFPDDHKAILSNRIPTGAMIAFNQGIVTHFGLEDFIAAQS